MIFPVFPPDTKLPDGAPIEWREQEEFDIHGNSLPELIEWRANESITYKKFNRARECALAMKLMLGEEVSEEFKRKFSSLRALKDAFVLSRLDEMKDAWTEETAELYGEFDPYELWTCWSCDRGWQMMPMRIAYAWLEMYNSHQTDATARKWIKEWNKEVPDHAIKLPPRNYYTDYHHGARFNQNEQPHTSLRLVELEPIDWQSINAIPASN